MMHALEAIGQRKSVRRFTDEKVTKEQIQQLLEAARSAPSAGNRQPWFFYAILNSELRSDLAKAAYGQSFVAQAPLVIVVCAEPERSAERYHDRGRTLYVYQDTAAAVQNILLAATAMGLGSCWVGAFDEEEVQKVMNLPQKLRPIALIPIGVPDTSRSFSRTSRRPLDEVSEVLE